jgi:hypothetical protein
MWNSDKNPFSDSILTYLAVFGVATLGGLVKYVNHTDKFRFWVLVRDLVTANFVGLLTFWLCEWMNIAGPLSAIMIATAGVMGTRLLNEFENLYRVRLGLKPVSPLENELANDRQPQSSKEGE